MISWESMQRGLLDFKRVCMNRGCRGTKAREGTLKVS